METELRYGLTLQDLDSARHSGRWRSDFDGLQRVDFRPCEHPLGGVPLWERIAGSEVGEL
jgi:hypothetical protein